MSSSQVFHSGGFRYWNQVNNGTTVKAATLYVLLRTLDGVGGHPSDAAAADTLTSNLAEVSASGTGYGRIAVAFNGTNFAESASSGNSVITMLAQTFNFTGNVTGITHWALATSSDSSGVLICSGPLTNPPLNVGNGYSLTQGGTITMEQGA